jgi:hypothetical protein
MIINVLKVTQVSATTRAVTRKCPGSIAQPAIGIETALGRHLVPLAPVRHPVFRHNFAVQGCNQFVSILRNVVLTAAWPSALQDAPASSFALPYFAMPQMA